MLSFGGNYWVRYMNENNSRLTQTTNSYTLSRLRTYADWYYRDNVRVFGEYLWADSINEELPSLRTDVDRGDILNLFVDLKLFEFRDKPVYIRGGRQEMLYGSQRLLSPLEWANTRRTFQGVKVFTQGDQWDFDTFWVQPVIPRANELDQADYHQNLVGTWATYRRKKGEFFDLYYLGYDNTNTVTQSDIQRSPTRISTMGSRYAGDASGWLWDFEAMLQLGEQADRELSAGAATAGVGRTWQVDWTPTIWAYYDYASGDRDPDHGGAHTFNQLFPFGHYYMGWMDLVGRQNIHDLNLHLYLYPARWITFWTQYHRFWLDQPKDALYGPGGNVLRRDASGGSGIDVVDELGLFANFHMTRYSDIMVSYNKLYGGDFLKSSAGPNQSSDADSLYLMFQQRW
ncbi:MAG: alginate export family protein [Pirellula sp.]